MGRRAARRTRLILWRSTPSIKRWNKVQGMYKSVLFAVFVLLAGGVAHACSPGGPDPAARNDYGGAINTLGWSPQGHIVFSYGLSLDGAPSSSIYAPISIYAVKDDGSRIDAIDFNGERDPWISSISPRLSPDGSRVGYKKFKTGRFCGMVGGHTWSAYVSNVDGSGKRRLTDGGYSAPVWSPDGERMLLYSKCADTLDDWALCIMSADGSNAQPLPWEGLYTAHAAWSPDGSSIALYGFRNGEHMLYVAAADGSELHEVSAAQYAMKMSLPSWSPDGSRFVFVDSNKSVYVASFVGNDMWNIADISPGASKTTQAIWSPNRAEILLNDGYLDGNVSLVAPDGALLTSWPILLGHTLDGMSVIDGMSLEIRYDIAAAWSPDGSKIAFHDGEGTIWTINRDGTDRRLLTARGKLASEIGER